MNATITIEWCNETKLRSIHTFEIQCECRLANNSSHCEEIRVPSNTLLSAWYRLMLVDKLVFHSDNQCQLRQ